MLVTVISATSMASVGTLAMEEGSTMEEELNQGLNVDRCPVITYHTRNEKSDT